MSYDQIPEIELKIFDSLKDIQVVFDVGSRDDTDYIRLKPDIEFHAFEPNPEFFNKLKDELKDRQNIYLNNFGLGDQEKMEYYTNARQGFIDGDAPFAKQSDSPQYQIRTLDAYVSENEIDHIDFLKIDTEGYDLKVIIGGRNTLEKTKYLQYEYWNNKLAFHEILEKDWYMTYIGGRTVLCLNKKYNLLPTFQ